MKRVNLPNIYHHLDSPQDLKALRAEEDDEDEEESDDDDPGFLILPYRSFPEDDQRSHSGISPTLGTRSKRIVKEGIGREREEIQEASKSFYVPSGSESPMFLSMEQGVTKRVADVEQRSSDKGTDYSNQRDHADLARRHSPEIGGRSLYFRGKSPIVLIRVEARRRPFSGSKESSGLQVLSKRKKFGEGILERVEDSTQQQEERKGSTFGEASQTLPPGVISAGLLRRRPRRKLKRPDLVSSDGECISPFSSLRNDPPSDHQDTGRSREDSEEREGEPPVGRKVRKQKRFPLVLPEEEDDDLLLVDSAMREMNRSADGGDKRVQESRCRPACEKRSRSQVAHCKRKAKHEGEGDRSRAKKGIPIQEWEGQGG